MDRHGVRWFPLLALVFATSVAPPVAARAGVNVSIYGIHMDPSGQNAKDFSRLPNGQAAEITKLNELRNLWLRGREAREGFVKGQ